jgi:predicted phage-related endonuclease
VRELLRLVHVERIDLSRVKREDFEVLEFLKNEHPDLYKKLRRAVKAKHGGVPAEVTA